MTRDDDRTPSIIERIRAPFTAGIVYADPVEVDGVTVIAAARVTGGGGGGAEDAAGRHGGEGGGFGLIARPVGAWVITDGRARWKPSIDVTRILLAGHLVAIAYFISLWLTARVRGRGER